MQPLPCPDLTKFVNLPWLKDRTIFLTQHGSRDFVTLEGPSFCVCLTEDSKLELFSARKGSTNVRVVDDKALHGGMRLYKSGGKVVFTTGTKLYSLSLR